MGVFVGWWPGKYVPTDSCAWLDACDRGKFCIHSSLSNECTRWYSSAAERETYRVVDMNGQRGVLWVVQFHESSNPDLTREARAVFDSIVFSK